MFFPLAFGDPLAYLGGEVEIDPVSLLETFLNCTFCELPPLEGPGCKFGFSAVLRLAAAPRFTTPLPPAPL